MRILGLVAALAFIATAAIAADRWVERFRSPSISELHIGNSACMRAPDKRILCAGDVIIQAAPVPGEATQPAMWPLKLRWEAGDVMAFATKGCVLDDSSRPTGFPRQGDLCSELDARLAAEAAKAEKAAAEKKKEPGAAPAAPKK